MPIHKVTPAKDSSYETSVSASSKDGSGKAIVAVVIIIAALAIAGCVWMFIKYSSAKKQINSLTTPQGQQEMAKKEVQDLLNKIKVHIVLPEGEEPTIATITDADALKKEQAFYRDAKNGDKVVIYMQEKKAIIYNEEKDVLVNVGPIFVNDNTSTPQISDEDTD